jgi:hypothetical protein
MILREKIQERINSYKIQLKTIDDLIAKDPSGKEVERYLACRRFVARFIYDLKMILK